MRPLIAVLFVGLAPLALADEKPAPAPGAPKTPKHDTPLDDLIEGAAPGPTKPDAQKPDAPKPVDAPKPPAKPAEATKPAEAAKPAEATKPAAPAKAKIEAPGPPTDDNDSTPAATPPTALSPVVADTRPRVPGPYE